jgi:hypothetical protein
MPQDVAPLLGQRRGLIREGSRGGHGDLKDLRGFFTCGDTTKGGQPKRHASSILNVANPMTFGHAKERFDGIGTDR